MIDDASLSPVYRFSRSMGDEKRKVHTVLMWACVVRSVSPSGDPRPILEENEGKWNPGFDFREARGAVRGYGVETGHCVQEMEILIRNSTFHKKIWRRKHQMLCWRDSFGQRQSPGWRSTRGKLASQHLVHWRDEDPVGAFSYKARNRGNLLVYYAHESRCRTAKF